MATRLTTLAATHRVVNRVHHDATVVGAASEPAAAAYLAALLKGVVGVTDYADGGAAREKHFPGLSGRQFDYRVVSLAGCQLSERATSGHGGSLSGTKLYTMD